MLRRHRRDVDRSGDIGCLCGVGIVAPSWEVDEFTHWFRGDDAYEVDFDRFDFGRLFFRWDMHGCGSCLVYPSCGWIDI